MKRKTTTKTLAMFAMFTAIILLLTATPLGFIPIGVIRATTIHIPVIVASIVFGPKFGGCLGGIFGLVSFYNSTVGGTATAFLFSPLVPVPGMGHGSPWALVIAFVPRILIGVVPYYVYKGLKKHANSTLAMSVAAFCGSMTNTILVMGLIYIVFRDAYAAAVDLGTKTIEAVIGTTICVNGVIEAIVAVIITVPVSRALLKLAKRDDG